MLVAQRLQRGIGKRGTLGNSSVRGDGGLRGKGAGGQEPWSDCGRES